jgi:hypothetical protein
MEDLSFDIFASGKLLDLAQAQYEESKVLLRKVQNQYANTKLLEESMSIEYAELYSEESSTLDNTAIFIKEPNGRKNYFNIVGQDGVLALAECISSSKSKINKIDLSLNAIGPEVQMAIFNALKLQDSCLQKLILCGSEIGAAGAIKLAEALSSGLSNVIKLDLRMNDIGDEGLAHLANGISKSKLEKLYLCANDISGEGVEVLMKVVAFEGCVLKKIDLRSNNIGDSGAGNIAAALKQEMCRLDKLDLRDNNIGAGGIDCLIEALTSPLCSLKEIYLSGNDFTLKQIDLLGNVFSSNQQIDKVEVSDDKGEVEVFTRSNFRKDLLEENEGGCEALHDVEESFISQASPMPLRSNVRKYELKPSELFKFSTLDELLNEHSSKSVFVGGGEVTQEDL